MGRDEVQGWWDGMDGFRVFGFVRTLMGAGQDRVTCCLSTPVLLSESALTTHRLSARATNHQNLVNISPPAPLYPLQSLSCTKSPIRSSQGGEFRYPHQSLASVKAFSSPLYPHPQAQATSIKGSFDRLVA
jgi:hypothetical protein